MMLSLGMKPSPGYRMSYRGYRPSRSSNYQEQSLLPADMPKKHFLLSFLCRFFFH